MEVLAYKIPCFEQKSMKHFDSPNVFIYVRRFAGPAETNHDNELVKTTAHFGRPEEPFFGGTFRAAYAFERWRRNASRSAPSRLLRSRRHRPRLLHFQISQRQQDFAARRVGPRSCCRDGRDVMHCGLTLSQFAYPN